MKNGKLAYSGWLRKDDQLPASICGIPIDPETRTRKEEYWWIRQHIDPATWTVLDAGTGYIPGWHMLPQILAVDGYHITACDMDPRTLNMPGSRFLKREIANLTALPYPDEAFDTVCCVSTLEHLTVQDINAAASELLRVAKRQLLLTADHAPWLPTLFGFDHGPAKPPEPSLSPAVYAMEIIAP